MAIYYKDREFGYRPEVRAIIPWKLFIFSLLFTLSCFIFYFLLENSFLPFSKKTLRKIEEETRQLGLEISQEEKQKVLVFYSQVKNIEGLLSSHIYTSSLLSQIEGNLLPQIVLSGISIDNKRSVFSLQGETFNKNSLLDQITVFEKNKNFSKVEIGNLSYGKNNIVFSLKIYFNPELTRYSSNNQ